jgi:hypothetical protein
MRIDVHAHYWTDDYLDRLVKLGKTDTDVQRGTGAGGGAELDARLRLMERAGVEMQVLSASPQLPYGEDPDKTLKLARFVNDQGTSPHSRVPSSPLARNGSYSGPTFPTNPGTPSCGRWSTSTIPTSTRALPDLSSTRTPAHCSGWSSTI